MPCGSETGAGAKASEQELPSDEMIPSRVDARSDTATADRRTAGRRRQDRSLIAGWAAALALLFLLRLGAAPLFDVDEGAFSEATREMLESHDFGHTTLNGAPRFDKPILVYWLQAASVSLFGLSEFALRLPSALCAWGWCLAVAAFAWPRWGRAAALACGTVLATSLGVLVIGRAATADALLNLLLALAGLDLWRHLESGSPLPLRRAGVWIGLGLLTKGPVALLVPAATLVCWTVASRAWRAAARACTDGWAWALMLGIAAPWYAYALQRHGMAFVDGFLMRHNIERYTGTLEGHGGSLFYYALMLPLLWLPWSPLLLAVLSRWRTLWRDPLCRHLLCWAAFVVVFFSLSGTKLPHYVLYGATPLALLMGLRFAGAARAWRFALAGSLVVLLLAIVGLPWAVQHEVDRIRDPLYRALIGGAPEPRSLAFATAFVGAAAAVLLAWTQRAQELPRFKVRFGVAAMLCAGLVTGWAIPWWGEALQGPVRRLAALSTEAGEPVVQWNVNLPSFAVYRRASTPRRPPTPEELALVRVDRLPDASKVERVHEERGLAIVRPIVLR